MGGAYLGKFNSEMGEQDSLGALPHLGVCRLLLGLEFPLTEVGDSIDDHPGDAAAKVDDLRKDGLSAGRQMGEEWTYLVQDERHQSRRDDWIPDPDIPRDYHDDISTNIPAQPSRSLTGSARLTHPTASRQHSIHQSPCSGTDPPLSSG
jgi:hypothetical protein